MSPALNTSSAVLFMTMQQCIMNTVSTAESRLKQAMEKFHISRGIIVTYDDEKKFENTIEAIPFWKFFAVKDILTVSKISQRTDNL